MRQGQLRIGALDAGDERHETFAAELPAGRLQQGRIGEALDDEAFDRAFQSLDAPEGQGMAVGSIALGVEHTHDVLPALIGAHFFDDRQPIFGGSVDALEIGMAFGVYNLLDGVAIAGAQFGIAADAAPFFGGAQPVLGAFLNQRALEFRDGAEHLQRKTSLRRRGVDRIG